MLPTIEHLKNMVESNACFLFVAEEDEQIIGSITLATYRIPSGTKAWIEDVVVDGSQRGRGIGAMLVEFVIDFAKKQNIHSLDLTSGPSRVAANKLYQKLGFKRRETNVYRLAQ
jgi:ribosomal protein S18 acetylase RimI-like enzyme